MDFPSFVLAASKEVFDLAGALAWPTVTLLLAIQFKESITDLLQKLTSLSAGGVTATFDQKLGRIEQQVAAEAARQGQHPRLAPELNDRDKYLRLIELSPS